RCGAPRPGPAPGPPNPGPAPRAGGWANAAAAASNKVEAIPNWRTFMEAPSPLPLEMRAASIDQPVSARTGSDTSLAEPQVSDTVSTISHPGSCSWPKIQATASVQQQREANGSALPARVRCDAHVAALGEDERA